MAGGEFSSVPLQDAYVARRCPVASQLRAEASLEVIQVSLSDAEQARVDAGIEFERAAFNLITESLPDAVIVTDSREDAQTETVIALQSEASAIIGGRLPDDLEGRRTGRPDILVRARGGWIPVDVKYHGAVVPGPRSALRSEPQRPWPTTAIEMTGVEPSGHALGDALQLAHYWRLLKACNFAAEAPLGGILARDGGIWWTDLAEKRWHRRTTSALALYDREFRFRLRVIARQGERNLDRSLPPLVIPLRKSECSTCAWRQVCTRQLAETDSVSLLPSLPWESALRLVRTGVVSRADMAGLDWKTAWLVCGDEAGATIVDFTEIRSLAEGANPDTDLATVLGRRKRVRLDRLAALGMVSVADLDRLDDRTATCASLKVGHLPGLIDQARAAVAGRAFRARGIETVVVPRADVEVDVDMENSESGVYLWGAWVTEAGTGRYEGFVDWSPLDDDTEARLFGRFWSWLGQLIAGTLGQGGTFAAYCYSAAENSQMRRIAGRAAGGPSLDDVEAFIASPEWVDLHAVMRTQIVTGTGLGLKQVAPLAGFQWRDEDPGGDQSMIWYDRAVWDPDRSVREEHRRRLLSYNEDDVRATAAVRDWLDQAALDSIEGLALSNPG